jgi:hypothetical protein
MMSSENGPWSASQTTVNRILRHCFVSSRHIKRKCQFFPPTCENERAGSSSTDITVIHPPIFYGHSCAKASISDSVEQWIYPLPLHVVYKDKKRCFCKWYQSKYKSFYCRRKATYFFIPSVLVVWRAVLARSKLSPLTPMHRTLNQPNPIQNT